jgi:cell division protein ZapA
MQPSDATAVTVNILDKEFRVVCPEDERDALLKSAHYLDRQMREIRDRGKVIGLDRIAVMAALNIAHELLDLKGQRSDYTDTMQSRIQILQNKIEDALNKGRQIEL